MRITSFSFEPVERLEKIDRSPKVSVYGNGQMVLLKKNQERIGVDVTKDSHFIRFFADTSKNSIAFLITDSIDGKDSSFRAVNIDKHGTMKVSIGAYLSHMSCNDLPYKGLQLMKYEDSVYGMLWYFVVPSKEIKLTK